MRLRQDRGAVAVETVFVLTLILIPLMMATLDLGRALYTSIVVEEVAQEGANYMAFTGATEAVVESVLITGTTTLSLDSNDIAATCADVSRTDLGSASRATVTVTYTVDSFFLTDIDLSQEAIAEGSATCA